MIAEAVARGFRRLLAGADAGFVFKHCTRAPAPEERAQVQHLYIHVPFCRHSCPYCPYNKIKLDRPLAARYFAALRQEIAWYSATKPARVIESLYLGGGSPSLFPEEIAELIAQLTRQYDLRGTRCIEIHPNDCDESTLRRLISAGITTISIGVQSFDDALLARIGRTYSGAAARAAVARARRHFAKVNVDLMFALPGSSARRIVQDSTLAVELGADQITAYPLFTFPYSTVGSYRRLERVGMPRLLDRRRQYYAFYDYLTQLDFQRVSVWSFMRGGGSRYSSVTRDGYLGFGAGSGTQLPGGYYLNTFAVQDYIKCIDEQCYPTALKYELDERRENLFWLYWRFYDTTIPGAEFSRRFAGDRKIQALMSGLALTGMMSRNENGFILTRRGAFWLHLAQNYFALQSINAVWTRALQEPFPDEIRF